MFSKPPITFASALNPPVASYDAFAAEITAPTVLLKTILIVSITAENLFATSWFCSNALFNATNVETIKPIPIAFNAVPTPTTAFLT